MKKVLGYLEKLVRFIIAAGLLATFLVMIAQVFLRYFFSAPLAWADEASLILLVLSTFLSAYYALICNEHLAIDFIVSSAPRKVQAVMVILSKLLIIWFLWEIVINGWETIVVAGKTLTAVLKVPMWFIYAFIWGCCILMLITVVYQLVKYVLSLKQTPGQTEDKEGEKA